ncbi:TPA: hypothetical protein I7730_03585 [Vibrio vulnificus]|uniref:Uncharacterized protein n=1 Tax=Vibrio vulnificus TaxID=672 RepID=A0A8H9K7C4_VIBVL|nr:hypothetical protein [Vibrio vulnificus]
MCEPHCELHVLFHRLLFYSFTLLLFYSFTRLLFYSLLGFNSARVRSLDKFDINALSTSPSIAS